ncbi:APC family permease [Sulfurovum sp.]|uniref:APC family permease n=1 Tax=Sulfurovum sp. TaxID=1969726 RepID=UPI0025E14649|nr:APC family permease [Sulfurovum sp.]
MSNKSLGFKELIAIAIGGMVGGGIFTILGISVSIVGFLAPFAIALGGIIAFFAAYSYVQLGVYYKDEGATYAFYKRTYSDSHMAASFIGWYTVFGYISTLSLYAYTFSSYGISGFEFANNEIIRKAVAIAIVWLFALINLWSVRGMGRIEDLMVYTKLLILLIISVALIYYGKTDFHTFTQMFIKDFEQSSAMNIVIVASVTFVAYEGFQLVINAVNEMEDPEKNIPKAIYTAVILVALIYFIIALGAVMAIPVEDLIKNKEYALASGAADIMGHWGRDLVIVGAVLATSSAISGTMFGSSRQMARIADDGYLPAILTIRREQIPTYAITAMAATASLLILSGGLRLILEFGSITFLLVSLLMAVANFKIRKQTRSSTFLTLLSILGLLVGAALILYYEFHTKPDQLFFIVGIYAILSIGAWGYAKVQKVV